jgi:hypothetical protein
VSRHRFCAVTSMPNVALFVEDFAHETFLKAIVQRLHEDHRVQIAFQSYSVRGGAGRVVSELRQFIRDLRLGRKALPDLLIVGRDANCQGYLKRRQELEPAAEQCGCRVVYAIPDPHIERWLLLDSAAFKAVLGRGCDSPKQKCERKRYKRLPLEAVRAAGVTPLLGGIEYTEDLVKAMQLPFLESEGESLGRLVKDLRAVFKTWERI